MFHFSIEEDIYDKNPLQTELGMKIIRGSVKLMDEIGFEDFTFKKLAKSISSTEASIYRYFKNKQNVLLFLCELFWENQYYSIKVNNKNIDNPSIKLDRAIASIVFYDQEEQVLPFLCEQTLRKLIIGESPKVLYNKGVDQFNTAGFYKGYKKVIQYLSKLILEIDPVFKYPNTFSNNLVQLSLHHNFYCQHIPSITEFDCQKCEKGQIYEMIQYMISKLLNGYLVPVK